MVTVNRRKLNQQHKEARKLPSKITPAMIKRAEGASRRNKAKIDGGETFRSHQTTDRRSPGSHRDNKYS